MAPIRRRRRLHYALRNFWFAPTDWPRARRAASCCAGRPGPVVLIVGCSRSGTSFVARMLSTAGVRFPGSHIPADEFNPEGFFEDEAIVYLNGDILHGSEGRLFDPPPRLRVHAYQRARIVRALAGLCSIEGVAGWKDPQGTLTATAWLAAADRLAIPVHLVGVFRNPDAVVASIVRHEAGTVSVAQALNAWSAHNRRLLELSELHRGRFHWCTVDQPPEHIEANLNGIAAALRLPDRVAFERAERSHSDPDPTRIASSAAARTIHRQLVAAHRTQWATLLDVPQ